MSVVECVPNFSEGRDAVVIRSIRDAVAVVPGILVLGCESDEDHNRTVITMVGPPEAVAAAALAGAVQAAASIDLREHSGVHPRIGAADVIPFIPVSADATMDECVRLARTTAEALWLEAGVPSFLYEFAATRPDHRNLEDVRRGGFEGLRARTFDVGGPLPNPSAGASAIGARRFLIACNVNLDTYDLSIAKRIAKKIRASSGGFPYVKALGLELAHRGQAQVSLNLTHHEVTSLDTVFLAIRDEVAREGAAIAETELIGFIPRAAAVRGQQFLSQCPGFTSSRILENRIAEVAGA